MRVFKLLVNHYVAILVGINALLSVFLYVHAVPADVYFIAVLFINVNSVLK